ncbi:antibiotic biosynthesis monooxygenase [Skermania sp. ID1734]|uniref:antibiotic biosynthesis monooxygenase n=1 Tax=Skermania sp. ID1734 TaxID=2597516 RepID=UPI00117D29BD|nr:antibiotic biosynthesis monooxygenase [Skermania sp. ID1734]TSD98045.1 antibiotic biosynthesis monooxygenase [Skermania sp. ID1734]
MHTATAISMFHPVPDRAGFAAWLDDCAADAHAAGCLEARCAVTGEAMLDWGFATTFATEDQLHDWLDSPAWKRLVTMGETRGYLRKTTDLVVVDGGLPPAGVGVFRHRVSSGKEAEFLAAQHELIELTTGFAGFEGTGVFPPETGGEWLSVLRFRTGHQLLNWLRSRERAAALPGLRRNLVEDFAEVTHTTTPFGSTVRTENGATKVTPRWKTAMIVLLVLYPTVLTLSRFLGPVMDGAGIPQWLALWLSQICSVAVMTWFLMPLVSGWFGRWLDPIEGAGVKASVLGAGVVLVVYGACLLLFGSVKWLQFWDYNH